MNRRFHAFILAALIVPAVGALAEPAMAQQRGGTWVQPPSNPPRVQRGDRTNNLDFLFEALKVAPDDSSAKAIEDRIWALWLASGGDTANLLMSRVKTAADANDLDLALKLLDSIIEINPDYLEAWNRR